jgi:hypothetical protein
MARRHLLVSSTLSSPLSRRRSVSRSQAFNKTCRRELGGSPRAIRNAVAGRSPELASVVFELIPVVQAPQYDEEAERRFAEGGRVHLPRRRGRYWSGTGSSSRDWEFCLVSDDQRLIAGCWDVPIAGRRVDDLPAGFTGSLIGP